MPRGGKRTGAGRKPGPYTKRIELRIRPEHLEWVDAQDGTRPEIFSKLIGRAMRDGETVAAESYQTENESV